MVAFSYRMPAGIAGDINRIAAATVEAQNITPSGTTLAPVAYGTPVVIDATTGNVRQFSASDTSAYGLLARPFPTTSSQDPLAVSTPPTAGPCDVLVRGYMTVLLQGPTAATKAGPVFLYTTTTSTSHPSIGGFEAATSSGAVLLPRAYFMGPADSNGIVEVAFNI
jgi:hypothetical protein